MLVHDNRRLVAAPLSRLARSLERWRSSNVRGSRIPAEIWNEAALLAVEHGVHPVSKALRLNYYSLKERMEDLSQDGCPSASPTTFVELPPQVPPASRAFEIELESPGGWKLRLRGEDATVLNMGEVVRIAGELPR